MWGDRKRRQLERKRLVKPRQCINMKLFIVTTFNLFGVYVVCVCTPQNTFRGQKTTVVSVLAFYLV